MVVDDGCVIVIVEGGGVVVYTIGCSRCGCPLAGGGGCCCCKVVGLTGVMAG